MKPLIAICGDSGVGKDYLTDVIRALYGENIITVINGDDFHKFERSSDEWKILTHLNPMANEILKWQKKINRLQRGKLIINRKYNHKTGKFGKRKIIFPKKILVTQGLHAIQATENQHKKICVFLEMNENLRIELKLQRDVNFRNKSQAEVFSQMERRKLDYEMYVRNQKQMADLIIHFDPSNSSNYSATFESSNLLFISEFQKIISSVSDLPLFAIMVKADIVKLKYIPYAHEYESLFIIARNVLMINLNEDQKAKLKRINPASLVVAFLILYMLEQQNEH